MKNYVIGGLVCLVAALVIGIEPLERVVNKATNKGTLKGIETCISYSSSDLLSPDATRASCITAFQKHLYNNDHATGRAGPRAEQQSVSWGGTLENKFPDHVTTWVELSVSLFDADGKEDEHTAETPIWIDPLGEAEFRVDLPDLERKDIDGLEFCDHEDEAPKSCMTWGVTGVMGVSI